MRYTLPLLASLLAACACSNDTVIHYAIVRDKGTERWYTINPTEYAIDFKQQRVIGSAAGSINRYDDCLVKSLDNWECNADNGDRVFGFLEGEFWRWRSMMCCPTRSGKPSAPSSGGRYTLRPNRRLT
jgi:hypothetical protein